MSRRKGPVETPEYLAMVGRMIRAAGRRVADADDVDLADMARLRDELDAAIAAAVTGQRSKHGRSWADVARPFGITKQAAQQRWGKATTERTPAA